MSRSWRDLFGRLYMGSSVAPRSREVHRGVFCRNASETLFKVAAYEVHCCAYMHQLGFLNDCPIALPSYVSSCGSFKEGPWLAGPLYHKLSDTYMMEYYSSKDRSEALTVLGVLELPSAMMQSFEK
jgi:hypothetical protein